MAYVLYNLTHLIPSASGKSNFGVLLQDDGRVLSPGKYRILNTISEATKNHAKKRVTFNGIAYEVIRIIETKEGTISSPGDRDRLTEILSHQEIEMRSNLAKKLDAERTENDKREEHRKFLQLEDVRLEKELINKENIETFRKNEEYNKFTNKDGIPSKIEIFVEPPKAEPIEVQPEVLLPENIKIEKPVIEPITPIVNELNHNDHRAQDEVRLIQPVKKVVEDKASTIELPKVVVLDGFDKEKPKIPAKKKGGRKKKVTIGE